MRSTSSNLNVALALCSGVSEARKRFAASVITDDEFVRLYAAVNKIVPRASTPRRGSIAFIPTCSSSGHHLINNMGTDGTFHYFRRSENREMFRLSPDFLDRQKRERGCDRQDRERRAVLQCEEERIVRTLAAMRVDEQPAQPVQQRHH